MYVTVVSESFFFLVYSDKKKKPETKCTGWIMCKFKGSRVHFQPKTAMKYKAQVLFYKRFYNFGV